MNRHHLTERLSALAVGAPMRDLSSHQENLQRIQHAKDGAFEVGTVGAELASRYGRHLVGEFFRSVFDRGLDWCWGCLLWYGSEMDDWTAKEFDAFLRSNRVAVGLPLPPNGRSMGAAADDVVGGVTSRRLPELQPGGVALDKPSVPEPVWGNAGEVLWSRGEYFLLYGQTGLGKTTVAQQILLAAIGIGSPKVCGFDVRPLPSAQTAVYVAADRPDQAMRSLARMTNERGILDDRLLWENKRALRLDGSGMLRHVCEIYGIGLVVLDAAKDVAVGELKEEAPAKALLDDIQDVIAAGIDVVLLHHPRKQQSDSRAPQLEDVYGSTMLVNSAGSVVAIHGRVGTGRATLAQLKAPSGFVEPFEVLIDYSTGAIEGRRTVDLLDFLAERRTTRQVAAFLAGIPDDAVEEKQRKSAERELKKQPDDKVRSWMEGKSMFWQRAQHE